MLRSIRSDDRNLRSVSPRSTLLLARACQARALFSGRNFISVEDVKALAPDVLGHRVMTSDSGVGRELVRFGAKLAAERLPVLISGVAKEPVLGKAARIELRHANAHALAFCRRPIPIRRGASADGEAPHRGSRVQGKRQRPPGDARLRACSINEVLETVAQ